jgi:hypothetical protein
VRDAGFTLDAELGTVQRAACSVHRCGHPRARRRRD